MPDPSTAYQAGWLEPQDDGNAQWDAFIGRGAGSVPYCNLSFADALWVEAGIPYRIAVARDREGTIRAGALVYHLRRGPYRETVVPPMVQYTPVVTDPFPSEADIHLQTSSIDALLSFLESRFHACRLSLPPEHVDIRSFKWRRWDARPFYTYRVDLNAHGSERSDWSSSALRLFKKEFDGFVMEEGGNGIDALVSLNSLTYLRRDRPRSLDENRLARLLRSLEEVGMVTVFTVRKPNDDVAEGGVAVLHNDTTAYYWLAASRPGPAMTVLIGNLLPELSQRGFRVFDFVGANTPSIAEFKRRFGPKLASYFHVEHCRRPDLRLLQRIRRLF